MMSAIRHHTHHSSVQSHVLFCCFVGGFVCAIGSVVLGHARPCLLSLCVTWRRQNKPSNTQEPKQRSTQQRITTRSSANFCGTFRSQIEPSQNSSYTRMKGRTPTVEERISMHSHKPHATSKPSLFTLTASLQPNSITTSPCNRHNIATQT